MQSHPTEKRQEEPQQYSAMPGFHVNEQPLALGGPEERGLYGYLSQAIYRLDSQTHQIVWKYTCASDEIVAMTNGILTSDDINVVFVKGGIVYAETHTSTHPQRYYLSALDATTGSLLWKQPLTRAFRVFVNSIAVYTLEKSLTAGNNTLTLVVRDPQTGQQSWQREYPIAGTKSHTEQGTDEMRDFRLVAVTDQLLYAVSVPPNRNPLPNEQENFTCYGLNPENGAILWQTTEVMVGWMSKVVAQIVDGIIYTAEYNLKTVTPDKDSRGVSISYIPQSRATARDARTGKKLWQTPMREGEYPNGFFSLIVADDLLYYQTQKNEPFDRDRHYSQSATFHALNVSDGTVRWRYQTSYKGVTGAVLADNRLYFETSEFKRTEEKKDLQLHIVALHAQTGTALWSTIVELLDGTEKMPPPPPNSHFRGSGGYLIDIEPVASKEAIYWSAPGSRISVLRPSDGTILEQFWVDKTEQTTVQDRMMLFFVPS